MVICTHNLAQVYSKLTQDHFLQTFTSFRKCHFKDHVCLDKFFLDGTVFALAFFESWERTNCIMPYKITCLPLYESKYFAGYTYVRGCVNYQLQMGFICTVGLWGDSLPSLPSLTPAQFNRQFVLSHTHTHRKLIFNWQLMHLLHIHNSPAQHLEW